MYLEISIPGILLISNFHLINHVECSWSTTQRHEYTCIPLTGIILLKEYSTQVDWIGNLWHNDIALQFTHLCDKQISLHHFIMCCVIARVWHPLGVNMIELNAIKQKWLWLNSSLKVTQLVYLAIDSKMCGTMYQYLHQHILSDVTRIS